MDDHRDLEDDEDDDDEEEEEDNLFDEDMEALRRACMIAGTNPDELTSAASDVEEKLGIDGGEAEAEAEDDDDDDYDLELVQNIRNRFSVAAEESEPLVMKPLRSLPPGMVFSGDDDADDDDFETLRAIQRRFAAYGNDALKNSPENLSERAERVAAASISSEKKASNHRVDACNEFLDREHVSQVADQFGDNVMEQPLAIEWNPRDSSNSSTSQPTNFPKSAKVFMDAIKKNRSFQKFLRSKLIQIEAKIEENKKLKERVKILKDFQVSCKKRTGRALSQKKDTRVQLISMKKVCPSKDAKVQDKKIPAMCYGPVENSHVANYRMALEKFPLSLDLKKWSELEKKNLEKGIKQQFQEMVLQNLVDRMGDSGNSSEDTNDLDNILASVKNLLITSEQIREFLPKVNWDQVASMYVMGRSGAECETRWLNFEDPLINHNPWTAQEDKNLLFNVQNKGISNWFDISVSLGTNRTPFQCLARYQRSLNVSILKREWSKDDDAKLRSAVEVFGEHNWQAVASSLEGWTGTQCSNRWKKSLHPTREKVGRWTEEEDKRLTVAQMLFGPKNWKKTAQFVPGRTEVQCRERWVNSLDPSLNWDKWTPDEDSKLRAAIAEHGYCWAKVAAALPRRTDNMCRRRWKRLLPHEVPVLQAARRLQKAALICNFVDRESERPAIGPNDFSPLAALPANEDVNQSAKQTKRLRGPRSEKKTIETGCNTVKKRRPKKSKEKTQKSPEQALVETNHDERVTFDRHGAMTHQCSENSAITIEGQIHSLSPHMEMQLRPENSEVLPRPDSKPKKRPRKPRSKGKELVEHDEDRVSSKLQTTSLNSSTSDGIEPIVEGNTASAKKKRVSSKQKYSRNTSTSDEIEPLDESKTTTVTKRRGVSSKQKDNRNISAGDGIEPLDESNTTLAKKRKVSSKRKDNSNTNAIDGIECLVRTDTTRVKKRRACSKLKDSRNVRASDGRNICTSSAEEHGNECSKELQLVPEQVDALAVVGLTPSSVHDELQSADSGTCEKLLTGNDVESDVVACDNERGRPSLAVESTVSSHEAIKETVLVALVEDKKLQNFESSLQAHRSSSLIQGSPLLSKRVNQLQDGNSVSVVVGTTGVGVLEVAQGRVVKEPMEDDNLVVDDDMTLACFMQNRSKMRGLQCSDK